MIVDSLIVMGLSCGKMDVDDVPADDGTIVGSTDAWAAVCASCRMMTCCPVVAPCCRGRR